MGVLTYFQILLYRLLLFSFLAPLSSPPSVHSIPVEPAGTGNQTDPLHHLSTLLSSIVGNIAHQESQHSNSSGPFLSNSASETAQNALQTSEKLFGKLVGDSWAEFFNSIESGQKSPSPAPHQTLDFSAPNFAHSSPNASTVSLSNGLSGLVSLVQSQPKTIQVVPGAPLDQRRARWVILGSRTQFKPIQLCSMDKRQVASGISLGLFSLLKASDVNTNFQLETIQNRVTAHVTALVGHEDDPIPGACCQYCEVDVDPQVKVSTNEISQHLVSFENGNIGTKYGQVSPICELNRRLTYSLYYYRVSQDKDFDEDILFDGFTKMSNVSSILKYGTLLKVIRSWDRKQILVNEKFGRGVIYNIIVTDSLNGYQSAYSSASTYACNITSTDVKNSCHSLNPFENAALYVCLSIGIFLCLFAHAWFGLEVFLCGGWWGGFCMYAFSERMIYQSFLGFSSSQLKFLLTLSGFFLFGSVLYSWFRFHRGFHIPLHFIGISMGLICAGCVFVSPIGQHRIWSNDTCYWSWILTLSLIAPTIVLCAFEEKFLNIFSASFCGSYLLVIALDFFLDTNMTKIMGEIIHRASIPGYGAAYNPGITFGEPEFILIGMWAMLCCTGIYWQYHVTAKHIDYFVHIRLHQPPGNLQIIRSQYQRIPSHSPR
eukprot:Sdes_comp20890_c0_seq1m18011